ncbi:MAG: hypothetical protein HYU97_02975 [Deltaproteobacteria bacterium]|nr:hypothetical protein [Deltaproteobacteria bacterium]
MSYQVNLRFDEVEIDQLKEIAERNDIKGSGKQEPHTKLIRETIQAVHFASAKEQDRFLKKYAYRKNIKPIPHSKIIGEWESINASLSSYGLTPETFEQEWLPLITTIQELGLDTKSQPQELFQKGSRICAIRMITHALTAKSEAVRQKAVADLLDRAGYKPVERIASMNVEVMSEPEIDALLRSKLEELGINVPEPLLSSNRM